MPSQHHSAIIIGVGPFTSLSLAKKLASQNWDIGLISRSGDKLKGYAEEIKKSSSNTKVVFHAADAAKSEELKGALEKVKADLGGGGVEVLCYNAARVAESDLFTVSTEILEDDFKVAVSGMLTACQWFTSNADKSSIPLLLLTSGLLHDYPSPAHASLSTVKSASYNLSKNFAQVLPEKHGIKVGIPCITEAIIPDGKGGYETKAVPDVIVEKIFMPFIEAKNDSKGEWVRDRVW